jgi:phosphoglycerol geranylgeranyltransferase
MGLIYEQLISFRRSGQKGLAVLLDPDKLEMKDIRERMDLILHAQIDLLLVGGSLITESGFGEKLKAIHAAAPCPVVLFPGSPGQIHHEADAILFLSLISGRNPDLLIGQHVLAAPILRNMALEIIPTGYMLIDGGSPTTASYVSQTFPIPWDKPEIAGATALAGEMLGLKCIYLDTGSGARKSVSAEMIACVRNTVNLPIIVGGGLRSSVQLQEAYEAGADMLVVGTAFEENPEILFQLPGPMPR